LACYFCAAGAEHNLRMNVQVAGPRHPSTAGLLLALGGATAFSIKAIIVKLCYRYGVDPVTLIMYRMLFALPLFLALWWWAERRKALAVPPLAPFTRRDAGVVLVLGFVGYYLSSFLDFLGLQYISAGLERLILYLNPTIVLILAWLLHGQRVQRGQVLAMAVSYAGIALVFGHELKFTPGQASWDAALGAALVFASALGYAFYLLFSGRVVQRLGALRLTGAATSVACVLCLVQFVLLRPLSAAMVPTPVLWLSLLNACLGTFVPVLMMMMALERIGAAKAAQVGMVGPVATIALGVVLLDEPLNGYIVAGTCLVLAGVALLARRR
jgi:drug/metabolite transporter (DMT)-like permease